MWSVVDRNVVMRRISIFAVQIRNNNNQYSQFVSRNMHTITPRYGWTLPTSQQQNCIGKDSFSSSQTLNQTLYWCCL